MLGGQAFGDINCPCVTELWKSLRPLKAENILLVEGELVGVHLDSGALEKLHYLGRNKHTAFSNCGNTICSQLFAADSPLSPPYPPLTQPRHMKYLTFILWTSCLP